MDQAWFEMAEYRRLKYTSKVWIPLWECRHKEVGDRCSIGWRDEYSYVRSLFVATELKDTVMREEVCSFNGTSDDNVASTFKGIYYRADAQYLNDEYVGEKVVMECNFSRETGYELLVNNDLLLALKLKREGDVWVCPSEGYADVIKLERDEAKKAVRLKIKAEFLVDYLNARKTCLFLAEYFERQENRECINDLGWDLRNSTEDIEEHGQWRGWYNALDYNGHLANSSICMVKEWRTDVDNEVDVPHFGMQSNENMQSEYHERRFGDIAYYLVSGEIWKKEWLDPKGISKRLDFSYKAPDIDIVANADGSVVSGSELAKKGSYLWFRSSVINELLSIRGSSIEWYTRDTAGLSWNGISPIRIGVNSVGLINVFAEDIIKSPEWLRRIWIGGAVPPDGGVSSELLDSQQRVSPAHTKAPEELLPYFIDFCNQDFQKIANADLFCSPGRLQEVKASISRFQAQDQKGLCDLAKDLARVLTDAINEAALKKLLDAEESKDVNGKPLRGMKLLEKYLAKISTQNHAHLIMGPLFTTYDLRLEDAHIPTREIEKKLSAAGLDGNEPYVIKGRSLMHNVDLALLQIDTVIKNARISDPAMRIELSSDVEQLF